jgi:hypothetical protein
VDETPWSVKGVKEWLWVVANSEFCLLTATDTRSRAELEAILAPQYQGVIISGIRDLLNLTSVRFYSNVYCEYISLFSK